MNDQQQSRADALTDERIEAVANLYCLDFANGIDWCFDDSGLKALVRSLISESVERHEAASADECTCPAKDMPFGHCCKAQPAAVPIDEPTIPAELHHDTAKLVRRFARALANKLLAAQRKYGYSDNWMRDGWADECRAELMRHIHKGDPRDVANFCMMLWHHGSPIVSAPADSGEARLTDEQIETLAHRRAYRYRHGPDSIEFIFNRHCLLNFARALLQGANQ